MPAFEDIVQREAGLKQQLSAGQMTMIAIGGAVGTGLFLGSGFAIGFAGPSVLISYAIGAVISLLLMGCLAEMTVAHPTSGSFGAYAEHYISPMAGFMVRYAYWAAVVLAVGARLSGQASCATALSSTMSAWRASDEVGLPVIASSVTPWRLSTGSRPVSSSLSPELEIASTTSPGWTMPRSPWWASAGCTNIAGVPVEASVAVILRPTWPLLPMPITTRRPWQLSTARTARAKASPGSPCRRSAM